MPPIPISAAERAAALAALGKAKMGTTDNDVKVFVLGQRAHAEARDEAAKKEEAKAVAKKKADDAAEEKKKKADAAAEEKKKKEDAVAEEKKKKAEEAEEKRKAEEEKIKKAEEEKNKQAEADAKKKAGDDAVNGDAKKKADEEEKKAAEVRKRVREKAEDVDEEKVTDASIFKETKKEIMEGAFGKDPYNAPITGVYGRNLVYLVKMLGTAVLPTAYQALTQRIKALQDRDPALWAELQANLATLSGDGGALPMIGIGKDLDMLLEVIAIALTAQDARHQLRYALNVLLRRMKLATWSQKDLKETPCSVSDVSTHMNAVAADTGYKSELWRMGDVLVLAVVLAPVNVPGGALWDAAGGGYGGRGDGGGGGRGGPRGPRRGGDGGRGWMAPGPYGMLRAAKGRIPPYVPRWDPAYNECWRCGSMMHQSLGCTAVPKCFGCAQIGHEATTCPTNKLT